MQSHYLKTESGIFHYKTPESNPNVLPVAIFLHGASKKSQHTEFWQPILEIITKHTFPVLVDRYGHGKSKGHEEVESNEAAISQVLADVLEEQDQMEVIMIGRSAGAFFAGRQAIQNGSQIGSLGLIAPAQVSSYLPELTNFSGRVSLLWDINDPVISFSNYSKIRSSELSHQLFTIGKSEYAKEYIKHDRIKKSHAPELAAPSLFEKFLVSLIDDSDS